MPGTSTVWQERKAERKQRRAQAGISAQPRNPRGMIIKKDSDGIQRLFFDTERAFNNALVQNQAKAEEDFRKSVKGAKAKAKQQQDSGDATPGEKPKAKRKRKRPVKNSSENWKGEGSGGRS